MSDFRKATAAVRMAITVTTAIAVTITTRIAAGMAQLFTATILPQAVLGVRVITAMVTPAVMTRVATIGNVQTVPTITMELVSIVPAVTVQNNFCLLDK